MEAVEVPVGGWNIWTINTMKPIVYEHGRVASSPGKEENSETFLQSGWNWDTLCWMDRLVTNSLYYNAEWSNSY